MGVSDVGTDWQMWRIWLKNFASGTSLYCGASGGYRKDQALKIKIPDESPGSRLLATCSYHA
eukprot:3471634-Rhodomonas_salina.2